MPLRYDFPFQPIRNSTAPSFEVTSSGFTGTTAQALESTAIGRTWEGPSGRAVRFAESSAVDYFVNFGSSLIVAASSDSMKVLGGTVESFFIQPGQTHVAIRSISTSTDALVNVTLGYGR